MEDYRGVLGNLHGLFCIGGAIGTLMSGYIAEGVGRRTAGLIGDLFCLVSYIFYSMPNLVVLYIARGLSGVGAGMILGIAGNHIAEIIPQYHNNFAKFMIFISYAIFHTLAYIVGYSVEETVSGWWRLAFLLPLPFTLFRIFMFVFVYNFDTPKFIF